MRPNTACLVLLLIATFAARSRAGDVWSPACVEYVNLSACASDCGGSGGCGAEPACCGCGGNWTDGLTLFLGIEGSKQPQDFGGNANLGGRARINYAAPLSAEHGIGFQAGTAINATANAVQVFELVGEESDRFQSYTSVGLFQRTDSGWFWGFTYDYLFQESYDQFHLTQWRIRGGKRLSACYEVGATVHLSGEADRGLFGATPVTLDPITQGSVYWRTFWESGTQSTLWFGVAEGHSEDNAVTGPAPAQDEVFLFGADIFSPLNDHLAIYGETNLMMPPDTGTVDAFLGVELFPWGGAYQGRRTRFASLLPVAGSTSMSIDLSP